MGGTTLNLQSIGDKFDLGMRSVDKSWFIQKLSTGFAVHGCKATLSFQCLFKHHDLAMKLS